MNRAASIVKPASTDGQSFTIVEQDLVNGIDGSSSIQHTVYTYSLNSDGNVGLNKEFILEGVNLSDLFVLPGFAYAYLDGEEVRTVYFSDHRGETVPVNYLIPIDFGGPVSAIA